MNRYGIMVTAGFLGGVLAGALVWATQMRRYRRDLFSSSPIRRLAALGYLSGNPTLDSARVLRDYIRWESRPALRRRGELVLRRLELNLQEAGTPWP